MVSKFHMVCILPNQLDSFYWIPHSWNDIRSIIPTSVLLFQVTIIWLIAANGEGFLAPYRGIRYHLHEYGHGPLAPQNPREYFNMKHAKASNVIERAFGILKSRWAILRSPSYYPVKQQSRIVMVCCLLHNFIRTHSDHDPEEESVPQFVQHEENNDNNDEYIDVVETSQAWTNWRDTLALSMYNQWTSSI